MISVYKYIKITLLVAVLGASGWGFFQFYPYIFAKTVEGKIEKVERVQVNVALMQTTGDEGGKINPGLYSFAVAIKDSKGQIWTASAEDRQWASMREGICVAAKYFPYPPWDLAKSGTYHGARILRAWDCEATKDPG